MHIIEIIGKNYSGKYEKIREACRGIIIEDDKILLSYDQKHDLYMIPGGGIEENEDEASCVIREIKEETGFIIKATSCNFQIIEYYKDYKYVTNYFYGYIIGKSSPALTKKEIEIGLICKWININDAINIFKKYDDYVDIDDIANGMYLREYSALVNINKGNKNER